jgi:hypothetical protein
MTMGRQNHAGYTMHGTWPQFQIQKAVPVQWSWQLQSRFAYWFESNAAIIGLIANQENKCMTKVLGEVQAFPHQGETNAAVLTLRVNRQRTKEKCGTAVLADAQGPEADAAHDAKPMFPDDARQPRLWCAALAQTIGGFGSAIEAEGMIEHGVDRGLIGRRCET